MFSDLRNFYDLRDFHASVFILGPNFTTPLMRDLRSSNPMWKFAGGKKQLIKPFGKKRRGEKPLETILRETPEELGIYLKRRDIRYVTTRELPTHNKHYFFSTITSLKKLVPLSREYEETKEFTCEELEWLPDFHPAYFEIFLKHIKPNFLQPLI